MGSLAPYGAGTPVHRERDLSDGVLSGTDRSHLVSNVVGHASAPEVTPEMKERVVEYWTNVHKDLGQSVARGLGIAAG